MTRKECIDFIKSNGYGMEATEEARVYTNNPHANYTNLPTEVLIDFVSSKQKPKDVQKPKKCSKCTDEGARKAILAIAKILNLKNIDKNFD